MTDRDRIRILREALKQAAFHFRAYEALHKVKGILYAIDTPEWRESVRKSKANREHAIDCERALQDTV